MVAAQCTADVLFIRMHRIVRTEQMRALHSTAQAYLQARMVQTLVCDIRGCKPIDADSCDILFELFSHARHVGIERYVRVGEGTLCAVQIRALELEADLSAMAKIVTCTEGLFRLGLML